MNKKTKYLLGILATILIGTWLYLKFCCGKDCKSDCCQDKDKMETVDSTKTDLSSGFKVSGGNYDYSCADNFNFLNGSFEKIMPVTADVDKGVLDLKTYLDANNGENLKITGYALSSEKNTSIYENLGLARAANLKNYFVSKGISGDRIDTFGEVKDDLVVNKDTLIGPASFELFKMEEKVVEKVDYAALKTKINANPLIMYFKTGEAAINLSEDDRKKVADMLNYLENVDSSKLSVTGHTDNVGKRDINLKLGLDRANFASDYLVTNGIAKEKIEASSKGPDEPIADNATKEGKDKNRRTVVTIK